RTSCCIRPTRTEISCWGQASYRPLPTSNTGLRKSPNPVQSPQKMQEVSTRERKTSQPAKVQMGTLLHVPTKSALDTGPSTVPSKPIDELISNIKMTRIKIYL